MILRIVYFFSRGDSNVFSLHVSQRKPEIGFGAENTPHISHLLQGIAHELHTDILYNHCMTEVALREKRQQILALAEKYGARNVRIFGSVARGEARPDSDIDFLVELEPGRSLFDLGGLLYELQFLLGVEVDVVTEKGLRARIRERVLREAIPL